MSCALSSTFRASSDFIKKADSDRLVTESKEISAMLHGLARAVRKRFSKKQRVSVSEN